MTLTRGACDSDSTKMTRTHHWYMLQSCYMAFFETRSGFFWWRQVGNHVENCPAFTNAVAFTVLELLLCCMKMVCFFTSLFFKCLMTVLKWKAKAAVKVGMQCGKLIADSRFYKPPKLKRKTSFRDIASAVRESAVCLHQCFSTFFASRTTLCNKKILGNTKQNFIITIMMFSSVLALLIY